MSAATTASMTRTQRRILDWVDEHRADVIGLTQALVRIPSENKPPHGQEKECQRFIADYLRQIGCRVATYRPDEVTGVTEHPEYLAGRDYTDRPNVAGVLGDFVPGQTRPLGRKSLLFSGHADVTPAVGTGRFGWWDGTIENGKLYGRGSCDMKGGMAAYMMAARCVREIKLELLGDLILESVVDEEFGGVNGTLAGRVAGYNADAAVVPEPNNMAISRAHRGGQVFSITTSAASIGMGFGESALPDPVTALSHILVGLQQLNAEFNARPKPEGFEGDTFPLMPLLFQGGELLPWGVGDAIPDSARLVFWLEIPAGVTKVALQGEIRGRIDDLARQVPAVGRITRRIEEVSRFLPGSTIPADSPILGALAGSMQLATGQPPVFANAPFACDVYAFNLHSTTPCALLGPRGGNAHARDEWVEVEDLVTLTKTFALTIASWLAG
jgi:acetylornithine deacetylase